MEYRENILERKYICNQSREEDCDESIHKILLNVPLLKRFIYYILETIHFLLGC